MLGRLDRYIARSFLEPFLVATAVVVGLYVIADLFGEIDDYLRLAGGLGEAARRMAQIYLLRLPSLLAPVLPIAMLFGTAYGLSQLSMHNEITAMRASGLSFWRVLTPIYTMAVLVALLGFANRELLVPVVEQKVAPMEVAWAGEKPRTSERVMLHLDREDAFVILSFNPTTRLAHHVTLLRDLSNEPAQCITALSAEPVKGGWMLRQVTLQGEDKTMPEQFWATSLRPRDLEMQMLPPEMRTIRTLRRSLRVTDSPEKERELRQHFYERFAYPLTGIVLVAIGVPFVLGNDRIRKSRMLGIGSCVIIAMVFYAVQHITSSLGSSGHLPPMLAAFLPIVLFGGLALYLLETVHA